MKTIGDPAVTIENLRFRFALSDVLRGYVRDNDVTATYLAERLGVPPAKMVELVSGKSDGFDVDALVNMIFKLGLRIRFEVKQKVSFADLTPEYVLDRMCSAIRRHDTVGFMDDVQRFWRKQWVIADTPDPKDSDPLTYALKACIMERMAEVWSQPPKSKLSEPPVWCRTVPPVRDRFSVISEEYSKEFEDDLASPIFEHRNIFAPLNYMFFV